MAKRLAAMTVPLLTHIPGRVAEPDVLVLHATSAMQPRVAPLLSHMRSLGISVHEEVLPNWQNILRKRQLAPFRGQIPPILKIKAGYAAWLMERVKPRLLLTFMESDALSALLHWGANSAGALHVNCAHSITFNSPLFAMADFDYYFLYGRGSLMELEANRLRWGETKAVLTGMPVLPGDAPLSPIGPTPRILYFSGTIGRNNRGAYLGQFSEIIDLARNRPDLEILVKLHPLENHDFWQKNGTGLPNLSVLDGAVPVRDALSNASLAMSCSLSSTPLDTALLGRVPLIIDDCVFGVPLYRGHPHLIRAAGESLESAVDRVLNNYQAGINAAEAFLDDHLAYRFDSVAVIANHMDALLRGRSIRSQPVGAPSPVTRQLQW